jgi:hypothetical protein
MRTPQSLSINSDDLASGQGTDRLDPFQKAVPELLGIQMGKDSAKGVVGRDTIGQFQESLQPTLLGLPK